MDPQVSTSFIPKKPLTAEGRPRKGGMGLLTLLSLMLFIASVGAAAAVFGYEYYLKASISSKSQSLERAQSAYDPGVIEDLIRLDRRINESKAVLASHTAASALFFFLSEQTLERVQFNSFDYERKPDGSGAMKLTGQADSFSTVALQSDQFGANRSLKDVVFSDISVQEDGTVTFAVSATVEAALLNYGKALENGGSATVTEPTSDAPPSQ